MCIQTTVFGASEFPHILHQWSVLLLRITYSSNLKCSFLRLQPSTPVKPRRVWLCETPCLLSLISTYHFSLGYGKARQHWNTKIWSLNVHAYAHNHYNPQQRYIAPLVIFTHTHTSSFSSSVSPCANPPPPPPAPLLLLLLLIIIIFTTAYCLLKHFSSAQWIVHCIRNIPLLNRF